MQEKTFEAPEKERFEFVLTINGNLVCRRFFTINNFQEKSLGSVHLTDAVHECYEAIDRDLKEKTDIYNWLTAPQVFQNKEEMEAWVAKKHTYTMDVPTFAILRDSEEVFVWNGEEMEPYGKPINRFDYVANEDEAPCILKFAFLDNGEEVRSISWDGNRYPRFVRSNIDLSNSRNKYKGEGVYAPYEALIIDEFNENRGDLISFIKRRLSYACSGTTVRYFSKLYYGDKEYDIYQKGYNERLFNGMGNRKRR